MQAHSLHLSQIYPTLAPRILETTNPCWFFVDEEAQLAHEEAEFESRIQIIREIKASNPIGCILQEDEQQQKVGNPVEQEEEEDEEGEEEEEEGDGREGDEIQDSFGVDVSDQVNQTFEREDEPLVMIDSEEEIEEDLDIPMEE